MQIHTRISHSTTRHRALLALLLASPAPLLADPLPVAETAVADAGNSDGSEIIVTARRRNERLQDVPIAVNVVEASRLSDTGSFNINRLTQLLPSVNFYTSNPRNSSILIRGLGAPFGLTNDGIEQGVGLYVDGVYYSRPASASFDFVDIERIEVLRGPQGSLYGKNTTAGSVNIATKPPSFTPEGNIEASAGNYGFMQLKGSVSGPLVADRLAVRLGFSGTLRDGTLTNVLTGKDVNSQANLSARGQLLFTPNERLKITLAGDHNQQNPDCCAQVYVRMAPTLRAANRQFASLAAASKYSPPSLDPFDRLVDNDSPLQAKQFFGGASLSVEWDAGPGTLTSITAYRYWNWYPQNDRDFIGLPITTRSANQSNQEQFTQEIRYAGKAGDKIDFVAGVFGYHQKILTNGVQEQGRSAALWLLGPSQGSNPALLDGLRQVTTIDFTNDSLAGFGQLTWKINDRLRLQPGIRLNYDRKAANYDAVASGGLATSDPVLIARKNSILSSQSYVTEFSDFNVSGDINLSWNVTGNVLAYGTYARAFKSGGVNLSGIPNDAAGNPALGAATVRPEQVDHFEIGLKTQFFDRHVTLNLAAFQTDIGDYQATVVNAQVGVLRGYLANVDKVRVRGAEFDLAATLSDSLTLTANGSYLDGRYVRFPDAPSPLELTGGPQVVDASGQRLPGISRWNGAVGVDFHPALTLFGVEGRLISGVDAYGRSSFSSNPTPSAYLNVDGYALVNARLGFRSDDGFQLFAWVRNAFDRNYFDYLTAAPGGSGLIVGQPGDPRTWGLTFGKRF
jgi:iron complex outermembrane receptor protein